VVGEHDDDGCCCERETPQLDSALGVNMIRGTAIAVAFAVFSPLFERDHGFLKMTRKNEVALVAEGIVHLVLPLESRTVLTSSVTLFFDIVRSRLTA